MSPIRRRHSVCLALLICACTRGVVSLHVAGTTRIVRLDDGCRRTRGTEFRALPESAVEPEASSVSPLERRAGLLVLLTVPLSWGTFEPAVRYVYAIEPKIPSFLFSLSFYAVASLALTLAVSLSDHESSDDSPIRAVTGGAELGTYLFVGNALQILGLETVPADRAAFLLQLTTIFVPLMQAFISRDPSSISTRTWIACVVALAGVAVMSVDGTEIGDQASEPMWEVVATSMTHVTLGDALIVAAALAYTFHCIRLEGYAKNTSAVRLGASKATTEMLLSAVAVAAFVACYSVFPEGDTTNGLLSFAQSSGEDILTFVGTVADDLERSSLPWSTLFPAVLATVWTGLVTCAYTITAQSYGQSRVRPVTANLIYTVQPICTALFAWILLGETLGPAGYLGGALIGAAVLLVSIEADDKT